MHVNRLADLAATIAFHAPSIVRSPSPRQPGALHSYYLATRRRGEKWHTRLHEGSRLEASGDVSGLRDWWAGAAATIEEVFVSEIMTRVFGGLAVAWETELAEREIGPIARSVYLSHLEARGRIMRLMVAGKALPIGTSVRLNHLRTLTERWSDLLVGQLMPLSEDAIHFSVDARRCRQYGRDAAETSQHASAPTIGWLLSLSLRDGLRRTTERDAVCTEENTEIAEAVLNLLDADCFDGVGRVKSLWARRMADEGDFITSSIEDYLSPLDEEEAATSLLSSRTILPKRLG